MPYTPYVWKDDLAGGTPITAARLNVIENAIGAVATIADSNTTAISTNSSAITAANASIASNATAISTNVTNLAAVTSQVADIQFNVMAFGAKGDGSTNDTAAVQNAVNAALNSHTPADYLSPKYNNQAPTVFFPKGTYVVDQINVPGTVNFRGTGSYAYAGSTLQQRTAGNYAILQLKADTDGTSQASTIEKLAFRSTSGSSNAGAAQIRCDSGIGSNSIYIRNCWFYTPEAYAIAFEQGDDIKIIDNCFDVSAYHAIRVGGAGGCSNMQIIGNTFFDIALRAIDVRNVTGLMISANKFYKGGQSQPSVGIETADATAVKGMAISGNHFNSIKRPLHIMTHCRTVSATGNSITGNFDSALVVDIYGSQILQNFVMTGNAIANDNAMDGGSTFRCQSANMQACVISMNSVTVQNATALMFNMPNSSTSNNYFRQNPNINFSAYDNFASGTNNG